MSIISIRILGNTRMLRSLIILIVLIVTIFIYGLYSTTSTMKPEFSIPQKVTGGDISQNQEQSHFHHKVLPQIVGSNNAGEFGLSSDGEKQQLLKNPYPQLPIVNSAATDFQTPDFEVYLLEQHLNKAKGKLR